MKKVKVFIVEDSILMQKVIADTLGNDEQIEVIGTAKTGKEALVSIPALKPDVVTLDVNLPDMSGLLVLKELMEKSPVRAVMLSAYTQKGAEITIKALELGALDFIPKPSGEESLDLYTYKDKIVSKIKAVAQVDLNKALLLETPRPQADDLSVSKLVVIGASTGGPKVILDVMSQMPYDIDAAFLIVQHMPKGFTKGFAERLSWRTKIRTKEAEDGDILLKGAAYVAPSGYHMIIEKIPKQKKRYCIRLDETPMVNYVRPSVDVTLYSVAETFEGKTVGVILSGMGKDGAEGAKVIRKKGGKILAQNEASCIMYGMPKAVVEAGLADDVLAFSQMSSKIREYING